MYARLQGVRRHFHEVHAWIIRKRDPLETEYHISSVFFNMDSAIECFVYSINSLGYAMAPQEFKDVTDYEALKQVSPRNILGTTKQEPLIGYKNYFPNVSKYWHANKDLLDIIIEQHDVSKHREVIYQGGKHRTDAPAGFFESLGVADNPSVQSLSWPMEEIILLPDPKTPYIKRTQTTQTNLKTLEIVAEKFCIFINTTGEKALSDAKTYVKLNYTSFQNPNKEEK